MSSDETEILRSETRPGDTSRASVAETEIAAPVEDVGADGADDVKSNEPAEDKTGEVGDEFLDNRSPMASAGIKGDTQMTKGTQGASQASQAPQPILCSPALAAALVAVASNQMVTEPHQTHVLQNEPVPPPPPPPPPPAPAPPPAAAEPAPAKGKGKSAKKGTPKKAAAKKSSAKKAAAGKAKGSKEAAPKAPSKTQKKSAKTKKK